MFPFSHCSSCFHLTITAKQSSMLKLFALITSETTGWTLHLVNMLLLKLAGLIMRRGA